MKAGCQHCGNLDLVLEDNIIGCPDCGRGVRDLRTEDERIREYAQQLEERINQALVTREY